MRKRCHEKIWFGEGGGEGGGYMKSFAGGEGLLPAKKLWPGLII